MLQELLLGIGVARLAIFICILILLSLLCTIILENYLAEKLGLDGFSYYPHDNVLYNHTIIADDNMINRLLRNIKVIK